MANSMTDEAVLESVAKSLFKAGDFLGAHQQIKSREGAKP